MHKIDLSKYNLRTDLIIENNLHKVKNHHYKKDNIEIDDVVLDKNNDLNKESGKYVTISFPDITDRDNYKSVLNVFVKELKKIFQYCQIKDNDTCLIIGLGNKKIISDALGSKVLENIIVTRHLYLLHDVDKKYRNVAILEPNVLGITGIDSFEIIQNVIKEIKPDFVLAIDSLCAGSIERVNRVIQITSTGITPGSGIGNMRKELSFKTLSVPVIAIGVPTVVDSTVIVSDSINLLMKKISYLKNKSKDNLNKMKNPNRINYLNSENNLLDNEKKELLGIIGLLNKEDIQKLMWEVLSPINANMIVTTKEIDFIIDKMSKLIGNGINESLHKY